MRGRRSGDQRRAARENISARGNISQFPDKVANLSVLMAKVKAMEIVLDEG
jgi:hypothetical protein